jgi:hypothetical protein
MLVHTSTPTTTRSSHIAMLQSLNIITRETLPCLSSSIVKPLLLVEILTGRRVQDSHDRHSCIYVKHERYTCVAKLQSPEELNMR